MIVKSWGNYPTYPQISHVTNWRDNLSADFLTIVKNHGSTLPFGNGRSYGDSCMASSGHVLQTRGLDRFIEVDWVGGIIKAEAGVTLEEVLNLSIAQGWFLPVTPGTKYVTLGGAVANDVHGKNHHIRGTFGCHVQSFSLLRSDQNSLICSPQENANLFNATIGGLGLTGIIEWVELKLMPITSSSIDSTAIRFNSIDEFFDLSSELDSKNEYSVAWIDCSNVGRGVFFVGNHAKNGELKPSQKPKITMPITPPFSLINGLSLKFLNAAYYNLHKNGRQQKTLNYDPFFYPLDGILKWNRIYGKKGFQQYQCVIPEQNSRAAIKEILNEISRSKAGSFLAVLKRCGEIKSPGLLSFPLPGISLALDFAQRDEFNKKLFARLDEILRQANGRLYPAKDAHMSAKDFKNFYPNWESLESLRDPALSSHFWNRILS
jgi:FAD/FMN-containing dehydrogenase